MGRLVHTIQEYLCSLSSTCVEFSAQFKDIYVLYRLHGLTCPHSSRISMLSTFKDIYALYRLHVSTCPHSSRISMLSTAYMCRLVRTVQGYLCSLPSTCVDLSAQFKDIYALYRLHGLTCPHSSRISMLSTVYMGRVVRTVQGHLCS
ncbi:hypothetical protein J6590_009323 [Homalodisca vitripennis]|nr:hypothetical protein J6590_009323 [Homalodisca vitripennis]